MDEILAFLAREVTVPIWVIVVAFVIGLVISIVIRAMWSEMELDRQRRFWTGGGGPLR